MGKNGITVFGVVLFLIMVWVVTTSDRLNRAACASIHMRSIEGRYGQDCVDAQGRLYAEPRGR